MIKWYRPRGWGTMLIPVCYEGKVYLNDEDYKSLKRKK